MKAIVPRSIFARRRTGLGASGAVMLGTSGVAIVEFALVAPILFMLSMAGWDLGNIFYQQERLSSAVEAGVEYGVQSSVTSIDYAGMINAARADADDPTDSLDIAAQQVCMCSGGTTVSCATGFCSGAMPSVYLQVTASETYHALIDYPGLGQLIPLSSRATLRYQ